MNFWDFINIKLTAIDATPNYSEIKLIYSEMICANYSCSRLSTVLVTDQNHLRSKMHFLGKVPKYFSLVRAQVKSIMLIFDK